ncbi:hypothetical protein [Deferrisoma camini]|uniref:hypothetical protein n=1 Tax=Deferrisoma camini TaxID=1035120 RepID=UPI00046CFD27|nr:hypothetical protein [Deferrisoma camini]
MTRMLMGVGALGGVAMVLAEQPLALSASQAMLLLGAALVVGAAAVRNWAADPGGTGRDGE